MHHTKSLDRICLVKKTLFIQSLPVFPSWPVNIWVSERLQVKLWYFALHSWDKAMNLFKCCIHVYGWTEIGAVTVHLFKHSIGIPCFLLSLCFKPAPKWSPLFFHAICIFHRIKIPCPNESRFNIDNLVSLYHSPSCCYEIFHPSMEAGWSITI